MKIQSILFSLFFLIGLSNLLSAQEFDKTIQKISVEKTASEEFAIYTPEAFTDSVFRKYYFGLRIGANITDIKGDSKGTKNQLGIAIGLDGGMRLNRKTALQVGLAYSKQGAQQDADSLQTGILIDSGLVISSKYNYLELPITIRHFPFEDNGFFVEGGVKVAYLLKGELFGTGGVFDNTDTDRIKISDRMNRLDLGLIAGVGYSFRRTVDFSVRYNLNFLNHIDNSNNQTTSNGSFRNSIVQVSLGFYMNKE
jgi:hypothetical protein